MVFNYNEFLFEMSKLTIPELNKDKNRWLNFLNKLKNNDTFTLNDKSEVKILNRNEILNNITNDKEEFDLDKANNFFRRKNSNRYSNVIETDKGFKKINDFMKTVEFGSSTGTSLGTLQAGVNETIQCLFLSLRQIKNDDLSNDDINDLLVQYDGYDDLHINQNVLNDVKTNKIITEQDIKNYKLWENTYIKTSNLIFNILDKNEKYIFYHSYFKSDLPKIINLKFSQFIKNIINESDLSLRINKSKWDPSDIYIVSKKLNDKIINDISNSKSLTELNEIMDYYFEQKDLIGISLKMIGQNEPDKIKFIINKEEKPTFKYVNSSTSYDSLSSMSVNINAISKSSLEKNKKETIVCRIFTGKEKSNIQLEIKGKTSMYGKIGFNYLNHILELANVEKIKNYKEIDALDDEEIIKYIDFKTKNIPNIEYTNTNTDIHNIEYNKSKLISKYQSLNLIDILEKNKNKPIKNGFFQKIFFNIFSLGISKTDFIVKELFHYGYSMGNELFDNIKYYRIIILD